MAADRAATNDEAGAGRKERKGPMEQVIGGIVDGVVVPVTGMIPGLVSSGMLFVVFAALWVALGAGIVLDQGGVDATWRWIGSLPLLAQGILWLLFLPVVAGIWAWETSWPLAVRAVLVVGLAGWNLLVFLPQGSKAP